MKNQKTELELLQDHLEELEEDYQEVWDSVYCIGGEGLKSDLTTITLQIQQVKDKIEKAKK